MKEEIVEPAWQLASENNHIKVFNFFPSFLATIYLAGVLIYQIAWGYVSVFQLKDSLFAWIVNFVHADYFLEFLIGFLVFFIAYILIIPITEGGLIALIDKVDTTDQSSGIIVRNKTASYGISRGLKHFLPVFEANGITALFKLISIITFTFFLVRLLGIEYLGGILIFMGFYFIIAVVINIFLAYTRFFIVLKGMKAFDAIIASAGMALANIGITVRLYITLLLVYVRTLLTVLLLIAFPFILSGILTYITTAILQIVFISILGMLGIGFLVFVSHLSSVLEIFVETLWYRAYIDNLKHAETHEDQNTSGHHTVHSSAHH